ncbi:MAG: hypothetical protein JO052_27170 [Bradyrhizobium sp.]|nr:hypothetical protein [Bradyrhizobium sp.]
MPSFSAPLEVTDQNGTTGTIIGPQGVVGSNPAGIIEADSLLLYGPPGLNGGPQRLSLVAEPGVVFVTGDDQTRIRMDATGLIAINDANANNRFSVDATGNLIVSDSNGTPTILLNPQAGTITILGVTFQAQATVTLDPGQGVTLADALGNTATYQASGWTVNGTAGCAINGGDLNVNGNAFVTNNMTVQGDVFLPGADCAEQFEVAGATSLEPGMVVVIDDSGMLRESDQPYDRRVAGVISGAGTCPPGIVLNRHGPDDGKRASVALIGRVFCKVDATMSGIAVGDLLTTSPVPGHAMCASDSRLAFGAVLGKALQPLADGRGLIPILVALQ